MYNFNDYVQRRDEVSYNPLHRADAMNLPLHAVVGPAASIPAALSGIGAISPQYRAGIYGNPYISSTMKKTRHLALSTFERSRDWLLNYVAKKPKFKDWLLEQLNLVEQYFKGGKSQVAGINLGQKPSTMGQIMALPIAVIKGILTSVKNVFDTLNPMHIHTPDANEFSNNLKAVLQTLDAMPREEAYAKLEEFKSVLGKGGDSSYIDPDARYS